MLRILRNKKTAKKVWIGLAVIIIPAFAFWGFGEALRSNQENAAVGRIFGRTISNFEFKEALSATRTNALMRFGDKLPEIEKYLNLQAQAWERLVLLREAKAHRINASDKEVIDTIQSAPYFQDKNGFNNKAYQETLRYIFRLQPRIFEEQTRQNLILAKLYSQLTGDVKISDEQIRQEYLQANQELSIEYIASLFSESTLKINPFDKEIADFYAENKAMFKVPATKDKPVRIPELTEIKDRVKDALVSEKSRKTAENKISECRSKLEKTGFGQTARECGLKSGKTAFFKSSGQIENLGDAIIFWQAASKLKNKQISDILSNEKGYYIIKLISFKPIDEEKFKKEKADFGQQLLSSKRNEVFANFTEGLIKKAQ